MTTHQTVSPDSPDWARRAPTPDEFRSDLLLALGAFCLSVLSMVLMRFSGGTGMGDEPEPWVSVLMLAVTLLPLTWRRRHPEIVVVIVGAGVLVTIEIGVPELLVTNIGLFIALYTLGAWSRRRRVARIARYAVLAAMAVWLTSGILRIDASDGMETSDGQSMAMAGGELAMVLYLILVNILYFGGAIWFGHHGWESARNRARVQQQAEQLRHEQQIVAAQAVSLERLAIARELHDAVAHYVSLMGVQTAAARSTLATDPDASEQAMRRVEESARRSVAELQHLVGTLREDDTTRGLQTSQTGSQSADEASAGFGVDQLPTLIEEARGHGAQVDWQVIGEPRELSPLAELNIYRIVQEALTNVRKHAGDDSRADVRLRYEAHSLEVEITDDGARRRHRPPGMESGGHGIPGMRERATVSGGQLRAEPRQTGGFRVRAEIPYSQERTTTGA